VRRVPQVALALLGRGRGDLSGGRAADGARDGEAVPEVRPNAGHDLGPVTKQVRAKDERASAERHCGSSVPLPSIRLKCFTFTDSSVLGGVGKKTDCLLLAGWPAAGSMPATRPSDLVELVANEAHHRLVLLGRREGQADVGAFAAVLVVGRVRRHRDRGA